LGQSTLKIRAGTNTLLLYWEYNGDQFIDTLSASKSLVRLRLKDKQDSTYLFIDNQSLEKQLSLQLNIDNYKLLDTQLNFENRGTDSILITGILNGRFYGEFTVFQ